MVADKLRSTDGSAATSAAPDGRSGRTSRKTGSRRGGRPTNEQAAQLDREVREGALQLFLRHGYEGTSMDAIAEAAGTTKSSLYTRFPSKEAIFTSVLAWATQRSDWPAPEPEMPDSDDLEAALMAIANAGLRRAVDPAMVDLSRIAISQAKRFPEIAQTLVRGTSPRLERVTELLTQHAATGAIIADEPEILAEHFVAMVAGMPARLASLGIVHNADEQERRTRAAVQLFLRGLRPD